MPRVERGAARYQGAPRTVRPLVHDLSEGRGSTILIPVLPLLFPDSDHPKAYLAHLGQERK